MIPSQCRDDMGDIKFIRNRCNLSFFFIAEDCWSVM